MFGGALDANIAAVGMRYGLCDGETETVTALRTGARFVHAIKTIEEMGERILRDDFPLVMYGEQGLLFLPGEPYGDHAAGFRVLERVVDQNSEELGESPGIALYIELGFEFGLKGKPALKGERGKGECRGLGELREREALYFR